MSNTNFLRRSLIIFAYYLLVSHFANSQSDNTLPARKFFKTTVTTDAGAQHGYLYNVTDTSVQLSSDFIAYHDTISTIGGPLKTFSYSNIKRVTIEGKGSVGRGALIGFGTGALVGLITTKKPEKGAILAKLTPAVNAGVGAAIGALTGVLLGALFHSTAYHINNDRTTFLEFQLSIRTRAGELKNIKGNSY
jgi:hypothetical protein